MHDAYGVWIACQHVSAPEANLFLRALPHELSDEHPEDAELLQAVLHYLEEHPQAMDTLEGIAQWWIPPQLARGEFSRLARAVDGLTSHGILERIGSGESARYRLKN